MLPPVTYSIQRLPQIALEKIPMCDVRGIDLDALPLQDSQLEVQQLGRYIQTSGHLEEVHLHLQRLHDLVITQHELRSEHICLILHEFMKRQVVEEVAALQEKLIAIQADCINRIKEIPVTSDLEDTMDELLNKISNQFLFQIEEPESASVVIGTARAGHFSWRVENGFRDIFSVEQWLRDNPEFSIYDEYGTAITWEQFKEAVAWCNG